MNTEIRDPDEAVATGGRGIDDGEAQVAVDPGTTFLPVESTGDAPAAKADRTWDISDWLQIS